MKNLLIPLCFFITTIAYTQEYGYFPKQTDNNTSTENNQVSLDLKPSAIYIIKNKADSNAYEIAYLRSQLARFHSRITTGYALIAVGTICSGLGSILYYSEMNNIQQQYAEYLSATITNTSITNPKLKKIVPTLGTPDFITANIFIYGGLALNLIGSITVLSSYHYIKQASIRPTHYGVALNIEF